jgi:tRNA(Ile)-lysidine synthase
MDGQHRKLQDVFTDCKVPQHVRNEIPLVCFGDEIIWIPGFSVHAHWLVPNEQAPSIRLELRYA